MAFSCKEAINLEYMLAYLDAAVVALALIGTLWIGWRAGRGVTTMQAYALANREFGAAALTLTFLATNLGGVNVFGVSSEVFQHGILLLFSIFGVPISLLIKGFLLAPKMARFRDCVSIGDVMGRLYGVHAKWVTGVLASCYSLCMIAMSLLSFKSVFMLLDVHQAYLGMAMWGSGLLLAAYTAWGGMRSVTTTDLWQFAVVTVMVPLIARMAVHRVGGIQALYAQTPPGHLALWTHPNFSHGLTLFLIWSIFPVGITSPPIFQRMLMARSGADIKKQALAAACFDPAFHTAVACIGLAGLILYPAISPDRLIYHCVHELVPYHLRGLAVVSMMALVMSSADSYLHALGVVVARDVVTPVAQRWAATRLDELAVARAATVLLALWALGIASYAQDMLQLSFAAVQFTGPLLMFPLIAGIVGLKPARSAFYAASAVTVATYVVAYWLLPASYKHLVTLISILANITAFLAVHLYVYGRWAWVGPSEGA